MGVSVGGMSAGKVIGVTHLMPPPPDGFKLPGCRVALPITRRAGPRAAADWRSTRSAQLSSTAVADILIIMQLSSTPKIAPEQFFAWVAGQEGRYELVDGEVVMMAGAGRRHDQIVVNLITAVNLQTRGGPCQTFTGDTYVATSPTSRRMPDLGVDCGRPDDESLTADKPSLVVEVLSPTTGGIDVTIKLAEYQALPSLDYILLVDTESPKVHFHSRGDDQSWTAAVVEGLDASISLDKLNARLDLRDIYAGLEFRPKPKLVEAVVETDAPGRGSGPTRPSRF